MNRAFAGAYKKGLKAGRNNQPKTDNPYIYDGKTFSTAFFRFWENGWETAIDGCDCENPRPDFISGDDGVWHYSNGCEVHNG